MEIEAAESATPEQLAAVLALAREHAKLDKDILHMQEELKTKLQALKKLAEQDLPNALRNANLDSMPLSGGWMVKIKTTIHGAISEAHREAAHAWLESHGMGGIIKHVITISFGRDEDKWAKKFMADLAKRKKPVNAERKDAVHSGTLGATIREQIGKAKNDGQDPREAIPYDLFGVYEMTIAELVPPKNKAASI